MPILHHNLVRQQGTESPPRATFNPPKELGTIIQSMYDDRKPPTVRQYGPYESTGPTAEYPSKMARPQASRLFSHSAKRSSECNFQAKSSQWQNTLRSDVDRIETISCYSTPAYASTPEKRHCRSDIYIYPGREDYQSCCSWRYRTNLPRGVSCRFYFRCHLYSLCGRCRRYTVLSSFTAMRDALFMFRGDVLLFVAWGSILALPARLWFDFGGSDDIRRPFGVIPLHNDMYMECRGGGRPGV